MSGRAAIPPVPGVVAFGGGPLVGTRLVRVIYLDETGHSFKEPTAAVAGMVIDPDRQWRILADQIERLKAEVPHEFRSNFFFHATDLFYGGKYKKDWEEEKRWLLLERLIALPRLLRIPLVIGSTMKPQERDLPDRESRTVHAMAYMLCLKAADMFMTERAPPNEVAMIVAEERKEAREAIRAAHNLASNGDLIKQWMPEFAHIFPISRIKAPPAFASKQEEILLQISDACAWTFQRHLRGGSMNERFTTAMFGDFAQPAVLGEMRNQAAIFRYFYWPDLQSS